jgi:hypothetical protein
MPRVSVHRQGAGRRRTIGGCAPFSSSGESHRKRGGRDHPPPSPGCADRLVGLADELRRGTRGVGPSMLLFPFFLQATPAASSWIRKTHDVIGHPSRGWKDRGSHRISRTLRDIGAVWSGRRRSRGCDAHQGRYGEPLDVGDGGKGLRVERPVGPAPAWSAPIPVAALRSLLGSWRVNALDQAGGSRKTRSPLEQKMVAIPTAPPVFKMVAVWSQRCVWY